VSEGWPIERIWINDAQNEEEQWAYDYVQQLFSDRRADNRDIPRGFPNSDVDPWILGRGGLEFVAPHHESRMRQHPTNRMSVVARVTWDSRGVALITGDIDRVGLRLAHDSRRDFSAHWLVAPHHGGLSGTPGETKRLLSELMERTGAEEVFLSYSRARSKQYNLPRRDVIAAVNESSQVANVRCTQLSLQCENDDAVAATLGDFHERLSDGRRRGACCAGSVILDLESGTAWRLGEEHLVSIEKISGRLCSKTAS
jgi:competence protein ComEC